MIIDNRKEKRVNIEVEVFERMRGCVLEYKIFLVCLFGNYFFNIYNMLGIGVDFEDIKIKFVV